MPETDMYWRTDRPEEGFYTTQLPSFPERPVRTFLPTDYQPRYPYPLVVLFHGNGGSEEQVLKLAPKLSRRNYICISLRGPRELGVRPDGRQAFGWTTDADADPDPSGEVDDYLISAVEQTRRTYHVHSERVFLAGVCEGTAVAYRVGFRMADRIAGVIALNGTIPKPAGRPLFDPRAVRGLRVLIGHGVSNADVPFEQAKKDHRLLYAVGADVQFSPYRTTHDIHPDMIRDVNKWIMGAISNPVDVLLGK